MLGVVLALITNRLGAIDDLREQKGIPITDPIIVSWLRSFFGDLNILCDTVSLVSCIFAAFCSMFGTAVDIFTPTLFFFLSLYLVAAVASVDVLIFYLSLDVNEYNNEVTANAATTGQNTTNLKVYEVEGYDRAVRTSLLFIFYIIPSVIFVTVYPVWCSWYSKNYRNGTPPFYIAELWRILSATSFFSWKGRFFRADSISTPKGNA